MNTDLKYIAELVDAFFRQRRVARSFQIIEQQEISGWEVWFQIEFANFLVQHESEPEWWREWPVAFDGRKEKRRTFCRADFLVRKKGWRTGSYAALEVKQHPEAKECFSSMIKDIDKISKVKASEVDLRSFWVLGIHRRKPKPELRTLIDSAFESSGRELPGKNRIVRYIPNSQYAFSLF
ncbi:MULTISPECIES: hypothetical protein [unclassified Thioalkalivibrio]|uniref:hypothetical protein n=1 Tax=unclassified Thioalkalivibrio TaxID=2621013 RepID=UPI0012DF61CB|nr:MULTISPECIES: hypothetical protein [unclassified Thioalkalivibrio]